MRVLVIGGTGFIGPPVVTGLVTLGHQVTVFHRGRSEAILPSEVHHIHGDRQQLAGFTGIFARLAPDVVLDMFPYSEEDAQALISSFTGTARRAVVISSMDVYRAYDRLHGREFAPVDAIPLTESAPLRQKLYPYGGTYEKILVERTVMSNPTLPATILRLPMVYGPGDTQHRLFVYLKRMDDHRPAILLDDAMAQWRGTRGYVGNVAAAITLAVIDDRAAGRIYNVGEADPLTESAWVQQIGQVAGWPGQVAVVPRDSLPLHLKWWGDSNLNQQWVVDTYRLRKDLGFEEPIPPAKALRQAVVWQRAHPPEQIDPALFDYAAEDAVLATLTR